MIVDENAPIGLVGGAGANCPEKAKEVILGLKSWVTAWIAVDGGANHLLAAQQVPAAVIGDLDSINTAARARFAQLLHPIAEQDSTDFDKALRNVRAPLIFALGFSGARVDHELAVMNVLVRRPQQPCIVVGNDTVYAHCPPRLRLDLPPDSDLSVFPLAPLRARSRGLVWPLDGIDLAPDGRIGTSNRTSSGPVEICPEAPGLLVLLGRAHLAALAQALWPGFSSWAH